MQRYINHLICARSVCRKLQNTDERNKKYINNLSGIPMSQIERYNIIKISVPFKLLTRFNIIPIKT